MPALPHPTRMRPGTAAAPDHSRSVRERPTFPHRRGGDIAGRAADLPDPAAARSPVVVLRLRGRTTLGATFIKVVTDYAGRLADADGRLYLSGLQPDLTERLRRTGSVEGPLRAVEATPVVGESTHTAYLDAEAWSPRPGRA